MIQTRCIATQAFTLMKVHPHTYIWLRMNYSGCIANAPQHSKIIVNNEFDLRTHNVVLSHTHTISCVSG